MHRGDHNAHRVDGADGRRPNSPRGRHGAPLHVRNWGHARVQHRAHHNYGLACRTQDGSHRRLTRALQRRVRRCDASVHHEGSRRAHHAQLWCVRNSHCVDERGRRGDDVTFGRSFRGSFGLFENRLTCIRRRNRIAPLPRLIALSIIGGRFFGM